MTGSLVNERALNRFLDHCTPDEAWRAAVALDAMAASCRLAAVELTTSDADRNDGGGVGWVLRTTARHHLREESL